MLGRASGGISYWRKSAQKQNNHQSVLNQSNNPTMQGLKSFAAVQPKKGAIALRGSFWLDALLCELLPRYRQISILPLKRQMADLCEILNLHHSRLVY